MQAIVGALQRVASGIFAALFMLVVISTVVLVSIAQCWAPPTGPTAVAGSEMKITQPNLERARDARILDALSSVYSVVDVPDDVDLLIARSSDLNAASFGNGRFVFWEGVADLPQPQLEALAAHEVSHDVLLHSIRAQDAAALLAFVAEVLSVFTGADRYAEENLQGWLGSAVLPRYSRSQELQADERAVSLLRSMGYEEPEAVFAGLLEELQRRYGDTGGGFLDSHPATSERIASLTGANSSERLRVTIHSEPAGAFITPDGGVTTHGPTPVTVTYVRQDVEQYQAADGCYHFTGYGIAWASGAGVEAPPIQLCGSLDAEHEIIFRREHADPDGYQAERLDIDLEFAHELATSSPADSAALVDLTRYELETMDPIFFLRCNAQADGAEIYVSCP